MVSPLLPGGTPGRVNRGNPAHADGYRKAGASDAAVRQREMCRNHAETRDVAVASRERCRRLPEIRQRSVTPHSFSVSSAA
jgi:hypothetical protein